VTVHDRAIVYLVGCVSFIAALVVLEVLFG
jgi:hypothetical protein